MNRVAPGYNHDIPYRGVVYHVQTEFLRQPAPHIDTQIYCQGRIVEAETTMVEESADVEPEELGSAMTAQHKTMIRRLVSGQVSDDDGSGSVPMRPPRSNDDEPEELDFLSLRRPSSRRRQLELRRSAVRVARAVRSDQPPPLEMVRTRLGAVVSSMADVSMRHPYHQSRHEELAHLLMLRSEAIEWLRDPEASDELGMRLWEAFAQLCDPLTGVNGRKDVIAHDRELWDRARTQLARVEAEGPVSRDLLDALRTTWGRYRALDELLDFCSSPRAGAVLSAVESALQALEEECAAQRGEVSSERPLRPVD